MGAAGQGRGLGRARADRRAGSRPPSAAPPAPPAAPRRVELLGARIDDLTMDEAIERIDALVRARRNAFVVTPNVDHLVRLERDASFRTVYAEADLVLADGVPLLWASRLLGAPLRAKVSGSDLFVAFAGVAAARGRRLFFLGGRPGAAEGAARALRARHPDLEVCGTACPPVGFDGDPREDDRVVAEVRDAAPDVLFVGLGSPKQELWIQRHRAVLGVPVSIGVGVSFEFTCGMVRRAPAWMQRAGLEWAWRLGMEPGRLWRRYLVHDTRFLWSVLRAWAGARAGDGVAAARRLEGPPP